MSRGGARENAGRKKGNVSEKTKRRNELAQRRKQIAEVAATAGITPLEVMLTTMREMWEQAGTGESMDVAMRLQAVSIAKDAAPYMHPRLSNVEATGKGGGPLVVEIIKFDQDQAAE